MIEQKNFAPVELFEVMMIHRNDSLVMMDMNEPVEIHID
jgi:hypothetical protein